MIKSDKQAGDSIKAIRAREKELEDNALKALCESWAVEKFKKEQIAKWSNEHKGLWYLPVVKEDGSLEALAIMKPINRHILSYATTKLSDEGLYAFLEVAMRECFVAGDMCILDDDEYFIPCANKFNAIIEGKKASLLKR